MFTIIGIIYFAVIMMMIIIGYLKGLEEETRLNIVAIATIVAPFLFLFLYKILN